MGETNVFVCSADDYFVTPKGLYEFDVTKLSHAHASCKQKFNNALVRRLPVIVVDNTNIQTWQYKDYVDGVSTFNNDVRKGSQRGATWPPETGPMASTESPLDRLYRTWVVEIACPDAATLYLFNSRQHHGVPWETSVQQWLKFESDPRGSTVLQPFLDAAHDVPLIENYRRLPIVIEAQRLKDQQRPRQQQQQRTDYTPDFHIDRRGVTSQAAVGGSSASSVASAGYGSASGAGTNYAAGGNRPVTILGASAASSSRSATSQLPLQQSAHPAWRNMGIGAGSPEIGELYSSASSKAFAGSGSCSGGRPSSSDGYGGEAQASTAGAGASGYGAGPVDVSSLTAFPPQIMKRVSYMGIFLSRATRDQLLQTFEPPRDWPNKFAEHCTLAYSPSTSDFNPSVAQFIGTHVQLEAYAVARGEKALAVAVRWPGQKGILETDMFASDVSDDADDDMLEGQDSAATDADAQVDAALDDGKDGDGSSESGGADKTWSELVRESLSHLSSNGLSKNTCPHVTLATRSGIEPRASNDLLQHRRSIQMLQEPIVLDGKLGVAVFSKSAAARGGRLVITRQEKWQQWLREKIGA